MFFVASEQMVVFCPCLSGLEREEIFFRAVPSQTLDGLQILTESFAERDGELDEPEPTAFFYGWCPTRKQAWQADPAHPE